MGISGTSKGRVLLAEDNAANRKLAVAMLDRLGYATDTAANGVEAVEAWGRSTYDAVLMDCRMPQMDGFGATEEIRRREASSTRTPIIAMTADAMEGDRQRCLDAGMDDYVSKPVRLESLAAVLERWISTGEPSPVTGAPIAQSSAGPRGGEEEPPLDEAVIADLRELDDGKGEGALFQLVASFLRDAESRLEELRSAVERGDAEVIVSTSHALVGSTATYGARRMAELCRHLETLVSEVRLEEVGEALIGIEAEFDRARSALRAAFPSSGEAP